MSADTTVRNCSARLVPVLELVGVVEQRMTVGNQMQSKRSVGEVAQPTTAAVVEDM